MLSLVATPIGNLSDISFRAIKVLSECDYILCEDTRYSTRLLEHYNIQKPLKSLHKFNEASRVALIIEDLKNGKQVVLISDAGTPGISDPGEQLVREALQAGQTVTSIPGACAAIAALSCSGLSTTHFQFYGFLPRKEGELKQTLIEILNYSGTTICYESQQRLLKTIELLAELSEDSEIVIARELTKIHEEILRGKTAEVRNSLVNRVIKGEIVLLIKGSIIQKETDWSILSPEEHVNFIEKCYKLSHFEAVKMAAQLRGVPKREIYQKTEHLKPKL